MPVHPLSVLEAPRVIERRPKSGIYMTTDMVLLRLVNIFYLMTERRREFYFRDPDRRVPSDAEHREIFQAVLDRDERRAVQLLDAHLVGADSYWQGLLYE